MLKNVKPVTILVADDDEEDRMLFQDAFEESDLAANDLRFVEDGEELMDYLKREGKYGDVTSSPRPAIILLDLNMPRKDGREALSEIRAHPKLRSIPVVVMTTSGAEEDIFNSYDLGVNSYARKPVSMKKLKEFLKIFGTYWLHSVELPYNTLRYHE